MDEVADALIKYQRIKEKDRYDRRRDGAALAPLVERCVRRYRDRRMTFMIVNPLGRRNMIVNPLGRRNKTPFCDGHHTPSVMCVTVGSALLVLNKR